MRLTHRDIAIAFKEPFASSRGVVSEVRQSVVRLEWQGLVGYGTALAANESELDECVETLKHGSPFALRSTLARLNVRPNVLAGIDMALHDLLGKVANRPLSHLIGAADLPLSPTAVSIGACPDEELVKKGKELADWPILKLKMTSADDGRRAGVLREVYDGRIWVDGNCSWTAERAVAVSRELARHGVELLEQPVPAGQLNELRYVHENSPIPVLADEDCVGRDDILRLRGHVAGVNIKLTKCGGLLAALDMITLARAVGLRIMLGCKNESTLGVTAMAQLAGLADHLDLDGPLLLVGDPFTGMAIDHGVLTLPAGPGLGVSTDDIGEH
jgi:L-alanine-DL-glutamate epimerase-like enolase superfamily enzyme